MPQICREIIEGPSAWFGGALRQDQSWIHELSPVELDELDRALRSVQDRQLRLEQITREDFPLPTLRRRLTALLDEIREGRGFGVLRGLPVARYTDEEASILYWGIGTHLGAAVKQNTAGDLLEHVCDLGKKWGELGVRGYQTNGQLIFHTDFCDVVGLLCLRKPRTGGQSRIASSITVHNEILRTHPALLEPLYRGFRYIRRESVDSANPVTDHVPVYAYEAGYLSCRIVRERIDAASRKIGQPLDKLEREALDLFAALAGSPSVCLDMELRPGDMQFLNNYTILHSRTAYEDGEKPEEKRHLLRLWLTMRGTRRPLAAHFPQSNGYATRGTAPPPGAYELGLSVV